MATVSFRWMKQRSKTSDSAAQRAANEYLDEASAYSFPASDPPSYMGSVAVPGAPPRPDETHSADEAPEREKAGRRTAKLRRR